MNNTSGALPGEVTGTAFCPDILVTMYGLGRYKSVAELVCGRVCAREMSALGYTPEGLELATDRPCPSVCKQMRVEFPNGLPGVQQPGA